MTLAASVEARVRLTYSKPGPINASGSISEVVEVLNNITDGVLAGQSDVVYFAERTVAASTADSIDLNGVMKDFFGANVVLAKLTSVLVFNGNKTGVPNTTTLQVGGNAAEVPGTFAVAAHKSAVIFPGGFWWMHNTAHGNGLGAVTATTGDILTVAGGAGASNTYTVLVMGRS